ncbi:hypothetical protein ACEQ6C_39545, partial [Rhizobium ruizarguesonis]
FIREIPDDWFSAPSASEAPPAWERHAQALLAYFQNPYRPSLVCQTAHCLLQHAMSHALSLLRAGERLHQFGRRQPGLSREENSQR